MFSLAPVLFLLNFSQARVTRVGRQQFGGHQITCYNDSIINIPYSANKVLEILCQPPTPYCDYSKNACVENPPSLPFNCTADGHFPHISDCRGSISCHRGEAIDHPCPENAHYDYKDKECKKGTPHCKVPNCRKKTKVYVEHPADESLYVSCLNGQAHTMHVCPLGYRFSDRVPHQPCEYVCVGEGVFADLHVPGKHNKCIWFQNQLSLMPSECTEDQTMDMGEFGVIECIDKHEEEVRESKVAEDELIDDSDERESKTFADTFGAEQTGEVTE